MIDNGDVRAKKFLKTLETSLSPFEKFVAKSDIEEELPLVDDRADILTKIITAVDLNTLEQIIPIVGNTGIGKTYILWQIKRSLEIPSHAIFLEVPANSKIFYYNLYTRIVEEIGSSSLREITTVIADQWGGTKRKYGLFRTSNSQKILSQAAETSQYRNSKHPEQLLECMKVILAHSMDPEKSYIAERWLLGQVMDTDELFYLGVENNLSAEFMAEELIKIILNHIEEGIILMFDDLDKNWRHYSAFDIKNDDEDYDYGWADLQQSQDKDEGSNNFESVGPTMFEELAKIVEENKNLKIVFTLQQENLNQLMMKFPRISQEFIHTPIILPAYSLNDSTQYYLAAIRYYREKYSLDEITDNLYFPLTKDLINNVHKLVNGNPREVIRAFQKLFDALVIDEWSIQKLEIEYQKLIEH